MPLIECPNCGKSISDRSEKCVGCGYEFCRDGEDRSSHVDKEEVDCRICPDCGARIFDDKETSCPVCGCPVEKDEKQIEAERSANKKKKIGLVAAAIVILVALVGGIVAWNIDASSKNAISEHNSYVDKFDYAINAMLDGGADAESLSNTTKRIWQAAIFDDRSEWDSDIKEYYSDDFNEALSSFYSDSSTIDTVSSIKANQSEVGGAMSELQGAPSDFDNAYDSINNLYSDYSKLTNLAVSPTGNLSSYSESVNDAIDSFMSNYDMAKAQIPGKQ